MENLDEYNQDNDFLKNESISSTAKENLHKSSVWVKIVAIVGIIASGLGALFSLFLLFVAPSTVIINLVIYAIVIYVSTLLLNVSKSVERGNFDMDKFAENFHKYYKIIAIFTIVAIVFTVIAAIVLASQGTMLLNRMQ